MAGENIENNKNNNNKKIQLGVRVSEDTNKLINELKEDLGSKSKVIEKAVAFYKNYWKNWDRSQQLWNRARKELNMFLVGKTTFQSYISGNYKTAWKENIATKVIEWITGKNLSDLSFKETLDAIKEMWMAANYFTHVDIKQNVDKNTFVMICYHTLDQNYGEFWSEYFKTWLENNKKREITCFVENEYFKLIIN